MGSWVRTITSPFRKARTILNQQSNSSSSNSGSISSSSDDSHHHHHRHRAKKPRRHSSSSSSSTPSTARGGGGDEAVEIRSSQLYGDVMACAYEDVQVMWSMLDNKSRLCNAS
uniref:Uncharacterized protein n=1 Tax=Leersia perrieri TaxID=77586 RepID=A0A0D9WCI5_9ORYZ